MALASHRSCGCVVFLSRLEILAARTRFHALMRAVGWELDYRETRSCTRLRLGEDLVLVFSMSICIILEAIVYVCVTRLTPVLGFLVL